MPDLVEDTAASIVNRIGDRPPPPGLFLSVDAGRKHIAGGLLRDLSGFGNQQAGGGPLGIIAGGHGFGYPVLVGPVPGHGGHDHAIGQG